MISENNHQKNLQMKMNNTGGLFKSYKYAQYKNVRGSKVWHDVMMHFLNGANEEN